MFQLKLLFSGRFWAFFTWSMSQKIQMTWNIWNFQGFRLGNPNHAAAGWNSSSGSVMWVYLTHGVPNHVVWFQTPHMLIGYALHVLTLYLPLVPLVAENRFRDILVWSGCHFNPLKPPDVIFESDTQPTFGATQRGKPRGSLKSLLTQVCEEQHCSENQQQRDVAYDMANNRWNYQGKRWCSC